MLHTIAKDKHGPLTGTMAHAVEFAETLNRQRWPSFDWLKEPREAFLAVRD